MTDFKPAAADVQRLRQETGAGMMDCKKALTDTQGDFEAAKDQLRKQGLAGVEKRASRTASEGGIFTYIHQLDPDLPPKVGVLIEIGRASCRERGLMRKAAESVQNNIDKTGRRERLDQLRIERGE